jgi:glutathione S-transferase
MVRRQVRKNLYAQGLGRHSEAQIAELGGRDIDALSALLADQSWVGGDTPCAADATVGAFVMAAMSSHFDTPLSRRVNQHANLVAYAQRIEQRFFAQ